MNARREITRAVYLIDRAFQQLIGWTRLGIRRHDLVLDVGSGGHPFIRADVLCDKFLFDNIERQSQESLVMDRPLVVADAARLPFRDGAFDFSHTSHLLEHLDDPEQHLCELQRVSRRGIVIAPSEAWERLYPISSHRWVVNQTDSRLRLREKPAPVFDDTIAEIFHTRLERYGLSYFVNYFRPVFEVHYTWEDRIAFDVERLPPGDRVDRLTGTIEPSVAIDAVQNAETDMRRAKIVASKVVRTLCSAHRRPDIWPLLICPACRGSLERRCDDCRCTNCRRLYRIRGDVPILLLE